MNDAISIGLSVLGTVWELTRQALQEQGLSPEEADATLVEYVVRADAALAATEDEHRERVERVRRRLRAS